MEISVHRDPPLSREERHLPAATYNLMHTLLAHSRGTVFVPIRAMQYLAIIDAEEVVFIDQQYRDRVAIAWCAFRPQVRHALAEPVPYECHLHHPEGRATMARLQTEFAKAMQTVAARDTPSESAKVLKLARRPPGAP